MYAVEYVNDEDLPTAQEWALVKRGGHVRLFLKESALCPRVLEEAWAGYRAMVATGRVPSQRAPDAVRLALHL